MDDLNTRNKILVTAVFKQVSNAAGGTNIQNTSGGYKTISIRSCIYCHNLVTPGQGANYCKVVRCNSCNSWFCFHCLKPASNPKQESTVPCFGSVCKFAGIQRYTSPMNYTLIPGGYAKYI